MKNWQKSAWVSLALCAWALPAWATGVCSDQQACTSPNDTCQGNYCVPTAKLCTGDSACQAWEKCDFTCPMGIGGGSSSGGTTISGDASVSASDASAWSSTDAGSSGSSSVDGGSFYPPDASSVPPFQGDATGVPYQPDADFNPYDGAQWVPPPSNCPASPGVCVPDLTKVPTQAGCAALCNVLVPCNLSFTNSTGSSPGGGPTPATDASSGPSEPDASSGSTDEAPDAAAMDISLPPDFDAGSVDVTPGPDAMAQCVAICSVWVLDQVAPTELAAVEQCAATQAASGCSAIEQNCQASAQAFMDAAEANDAWSLGMGGSSMATGGDTGTTPQAGDASPVLANGDASTGANSADSGSDAQQQSGDTAGGDTGHQVGTDSVGSSAPASSGCTAGTASQTAPLGLAILGLLASALILRRRRNA